MRRVGICRLCPLKGYYFCQKIGGVYCVRTLLFQRKSAEFQDSTVSSQLFDAVIIYGLLTACVRAEALHSALRAQHSAVTAQQFPSCTAPFVPWILIPYLTQKNLCWATPEPVKSVWRKVSQSKGPCKKSQHLAANSELLTLRNSKCYFLPHLLYTSWVKLQGTICLGFSILFFFSVL